MGKKRVSKPKRNATAMKHQMDQAELAREKARKEYIASLKEPEQSLYLTLGYRGRMVSFSKSFYGQEKPKNVAIFNANVVLEVNGKCQKLWYGDLDLTLDERKLGELAGRLNATVYVLREMDGRFENEAEPRVDKAVFRIDPGQKYGIVGESLLNYTERDGHKKIVYRKDFR